MKYKIFLYFLLVYHKMNANMRISLLTESLYGCVREKEMCKHNSKAKGRSWLLRNAIWLHTEGG